MNEPVTAPAYTLPTAPVPKTGKILLISLIAILILAIGAAAYLYVAHAGDLAFRGTRYLAGTFEERALFELDWQGNAEQVSLPVVGRVVDYVRSGGVEAAIFLSDAGQQVYLLGSESRVLVAGEGIRSGLSVSPDGASVAYAERMTQAADATATEFYDPASWEVHVVSVGSGENAVVGTGYAPQLFTRDGVSYVLYTTDAGVRVRNLSSNAEQELALELGHLRGVFPAIAAEDGRTVALPTPGGFYMLYTLTHDGGTFALGEGRSVPEGATTLAFDGHELVSLIRDADSVHLTRSRLSSSEEATVSKSAPVQSITKLIP